jgi:hypothetical protein
MFGNPELGKRYGTLPTKGRRVKTARRPAYARCVMIRLRIGRDAAGDHRFNFGDDSTGSPRSMVLHRHVERRGEAGCGAGTWSIPLLTPGTAAAGPWKSFKDSLSNFSYRPLGVVQRGPPIESLSQIWGTGESLRAQSGPLSRGTAARTGRAPDGGVAGARPRVSALSIAP